MKIENSKPFSNGTEYEIFLDVYCFQCDKFKQNCPIYRAMEEARLGGIFPAEKIVQINEDDGTVRYFNVCTEFETNDKTIMEGYKLLFTED